MSSNLMLSHCAAKNSGQREDAPTARCWKNERPKASRASRSVASNASCSPDVSASIERLWYFTIFSD